MTGVQPRGFTLIELVVAIVILGVLTAFALPRFADLQAEARASALEGILGSTKSAASLAHAASLTSGLGPNAPINMEGATVSMLGRYPDAGGMLIAASIEPNDDFQVAQFGDVAFIVFATGRAWTNCGFAYVRAIPPTFPNPRYFGPNTGNCR